MRAWAIVGIAVGSLLAALPCEAGSSSCLVGTALGVSGDADEVRATRAAIEAQCPCDQFDGSADNGKGAYRRCAKSAINGMVGAGLLRSQCRAKVRRMVTKSVCGYPASSHATVCVREAVDSGVVSCSIRAPGSHCRSVSGQYKESKCVHAEHCIDGADTNGDLLIAAPGDSGKCAPRSTPTPQPTPIVSAPDPFPTGLGGKLLADLVNAFRATNGKRSLPLSHTMMATAGAHVFDLTEHPGTDGGSCLPHSWSKKGDGLWTGCCYTADAAQADCMWRKPRELSAGLGLTHYPGNGYEIAVRGWDGMSAQQVLDAFVNSPPHRAVILGTDGWEFLEAHPAMGAALRGGYAVVWFGDASDPAR